MNTLSSSAAIEVMSEQIPAVPPIESSITGLLDSMCEYFGSTYSALYSMDSAALRVLFECGSPPSIDLKSVVLSSLASCNSSNTPVYALPIDHKKVVFSVPILIRDQYFFLLSTCSVDELEQSRSRIFIDVMTRNFSLHLSNPLLLDSAADNEESVLKVSKLSNDLLFIKDRQFRIVYANKAFLSVYPEEMRERVIGYTTVEEFEPQEAELFLANDKKAFNEGCSSVVEEIHMPNGELRILKTTKQRFLNKEGEPLILGIARDITEEALLIKKLEKANIELQEYTSLASHDLKSPLNAIEKLLIWVKEDSEDKLDSESNENLNLAIQRATRMKAMLSDLLKYAKAGKSNECAINTSLSEVVEDAVNFIDTDKQLKIEVNDIALSVQKMMFTTVLVNLISNSIKHSDKGHIKIIVRGEMTKNFFVIKVSDNGPGIEEQYQAKIFNLFSTLRPRDHIEGSGIGLSIVTKTLSEIGGRVEVQSDGVNGSTFTIFWPLRLKEGRA